MTETPVDFSCPDWWERLQAGKSLIPAIPIDEAEGERAVRIFNRLRLPDVPDQPALEQAAGAWSRDIVRVAFGSLDRATGVRGVHEIFELVPKKNSKTTTGGAAVMMTALLMNERPRAELLLVGPTQEIADLAFQQCAGMIDADPDGYLQKRFQVQEHLKTIVDRRNKSKLKIKTFDMKVMTGTKPVIVLLDELHIMSTFSYATRVLGQIRGGLMNKPESLLIIITTQSDEPPAGVFKSELQYARDVRDGRSRNDARMLPILYEFPEAVQTGEAQAWRDPKLWPLVTPNLGRSVFIERMIADFNTAAEKGDEELKRWASQHLNIEIGLGLHAARWRGADYWEAAEDPTITFEALLERCEVVVPGIDGGGLDDLLGLVLLGREKGTARWLAWARAWAHQDVLQRRKDIAERLRDFVADGDLVICESPTEDLEGVADIIVKVRDAGLLADKAAIGFDPQSIAALVDELAGREIRDEQMVGVPQGFRLSPAIWGGERKLKDGTLLHGGQPLLTWCVGNAQAEQRGNAVLITKQTAGKAKIDPLIALFNAIVLMSRNPEAEGVVDLSDFIKHAAMFA